MTQPPVPTIQPLTNEQLLIGARSTTTAQTPASAASRQVVGRMLSESLARTPRLMHVLKDAEDQALLIAGYHEMYDEDRKLAELDMAAGSETLPG